MTSPQVILVDDHTLFREALSLLLRGRGVQVIGEAADGAEGWELARRLRPDVVLIDLAMPVMGGLEATRMIKAELPELRVVVLTASEDDEDLFEAVKAGAQGYLLKSLNADTFVGLIHGAARGEPALTPPLAAKILAEFARVTQPLPPGTHSSAPDKEESFKVLTPREQEVLQLVVAGLSNRDIAVRLVLSENTVKYHLKNILEKLHLQNRAQVVALALRQGIVASP